MFSLFSNTKYGAIGSCDKNHSSLMETTRTTTPRSAMPSEDPQKFPGSLDGDDQILEPFSLHPIDHEPSLYNQSPSMATSTPHNVTTSFMIACVTKEAVGESLLASPSQNPYEEGSARIVCPDYIPLSSYDGMTRLDPWLHNSPPVLFRQASRESIKSCQEDKIGNREKVSATVINSSPVTSYASPLSSLQVQEVFQIMDTPSMVNQNDNFALCNPKSSVEKTRVKRGSGWRIPRGLGLQGGADTMTNGPTGWGPPPNSGSNAGSNPGSSGGGGLGGGWGSAPPPNPSASASWGSPNASSEDASNKAGASAAGAKSSAVPVPPPTQPTQTSTSWAAAAGKGLPAPVNNSNGTYSGGNTTASKQLEQLNSVREALFSQDGWGGCNVKQDTSWDIESRSNGPESTNPAVTTPAPKESSVWVGSNGNQRNDGTDLWKTTLSGQPPVSKPQPANPWGHTPQNPADYKNWGEDDEHASNASGKTQGDGWRSEPRGNGGVTSITAPVSNWSESSHPIARDISSSHAEPGSGGNSGNSWGAAANQRQATPGQWGNGPTAAAVRWDNDSPTLARRTHPPPEETGTSLWGGKLNNQSVSTSSASKWQDMPNMPRGPPGPPRSMLGGGIVSPKEPWGQAPAASRGGGWVEDTKNVPWGDDSKRDHATNWGTDNQWNKSPRNVPQQNVRSSPNSWDDPALGSSNDTPGWGNAKPDLSKGKELIWNSKQFRILCDMGFRKDEVESTLRATNLRLEDAIEILNNRRLPGSHMDQPYGADPVHEGIRSFPGLPFGQENSSGALSTMASGSNLSHNPNLPNKMMPGMGGGNAPSTPTINMMPQQQRQPPTQQPSAQQLRILVHQIQMAVQAGHLNHQILNQPLAPQTLILLNQLLQQIKHLQSLQQQHSMTPRGNASNQALMNVTVSITKTKQHIQNLQNQISAQQANYLKSVPQTHNPNVTSAPEPTSTVQEMFNGLNLMSGDNQTSNNGSRLAQWKLPKEFPKAPGSGTAKVGSPNLLLDNGPWGRSSDANDGWPEPSKGNVDSDFGIPEFEPGKPWKGPGLKNPDEDPNLTPGSVAAMPIGSLSKVGSNHNLMHGNSVNENNALGLASANAWNFGNSKGEIAKQSVGPTWLGGMSSNVNNSAAANSNNSSLTQIGQDLWGGKTSSVRAPPGMTPSNNSSPWPQPSNNGWAGGGDSGNCGSAWLLLKNLTPQIDGSTLKTLCMQHGPLQHFDLYLNHSIALVMYASSREAAKAQKALNNCLLGNTTIHANTTSENDISAILQQLGVSTGQQPGSGAGGGNGTPTRGNTPSNPLLGKANEMWGDVPTCSASTNMPPTSVGSSLFASGSVWGAPDSASSLASFLPGDLVDNI